MRGGAGRLEQGRKRLLQRMEIDAMSGCRRMNAVDREGAGGVGGGDVLEGEFTGSDAPGDLDSKMQRRNTVVLRDLFHGPGCGRKIPCLQVGQARRGDRIDKADV